MWLQTTLLQWPAGGAVVNHENSQYCTSDFVPVFCSNMFSPQDVSVHVDPTVPDFPTML